MRSKNSADKVIGTGTADANGKFTITISPALTDSSKGSVIAIDSSGNKSTALEIIGSDKDTIPPAKPSFSVYDDNGTSLKQLSANAETEDTTPKFTAKVESYATLTIYDNGVAISIIKIGDVGNSKNWSFTLDKELTLGLF